MKTFQAIVETYANNSDGHYPKDLNTLYSEALKKNYWKEIRNPYSKQTNIQSICLNYTEYKNMKNKSPKGAPVSINSGINPGPKEFGGNPGLKVRGILNTNKEKLKGLILYEPAGESIRLKNNTGFLSYKIYATDEKGVLLKDGAKIETISNN